MSAASKTGCSQRDLDKGQSATQEAVPDPICEAEWGVYQYKGRIIEAIAAIDIYSFEDFLVADFQIPSAAGFAKGLKARTQIQRIVFLQETGRNFSLFGLKRQFQLRLSDDVGHGWIRNPMPSQGGFPDSSTKADFGTRALNRTLSHSRRPSTGQAADSERPQSARNWFSEGVQLTQP
jgi:hypothetical protein